MSDKAEALTAVLQHYGVVNVRPTGRYMASCPHHSDRTPSLSVDMTKGVANCHSCGKGGDAFTFVQEAEGLGFVEAKAFIAELGVEVAGSEQEEEYVGSMFGGRRVSTRSKPGAKSTSTGGGWKPSWKR